MIRQALRRLGWRDLCWFVAGFALIVLMRRNLLDYEQQMAEVRVPAAIGTRTLLDDIAVTVEGFRLAHGYRIAGSDSGGDAAEGRVLKTPGLWVAVPLTIEMRRAPGYVSARLRTRDGLLYSANSDNRPYLRGVNIAGTQVLPGLPKRGVFFFEAPPQKLVGAHLELFHGLGQSSLDAVVDIDLGIDAAALANARDEVDLRP